jgi:hypothetical protein
MQNVVVVTFLFFIGVSRLIKAWVFLPAQLRRRPKF